MSAATQARRAPRPHLHARRIRYAQGPQRRIARNRALLPTHGNRAGASVSLARVTGMTGRIVGPDKIVARIRAPWSGAQAIA